MARTSQFHGIDTSTALGDTPGYEVVREAVRVDDEAIDRLQAALVVRTHRGGDHAERIGGCRPQPELAAVAKEERAEVHRAAGAVGRDEVEIVL